MKDWNVVLGIYQNHDTAKVAVQELEQQGFCRIASIYHAKDEKFKIEKPLNIPRSLSLAFVGFFALIFSLNFFVFPEYFTDDTDAFIVYATIGLIVGLTMAFALSIYRISGETVRKYQQCVFDGETFILAEVKKTEIRGVLELMRHVKGSHPATFLISSDAESERAKRMTLLKTPELAEELQQTAVSLACATNDLVPSHYFDTSLLNQLNTLEKNLHVLHEEIAKADYVEQSSPASTEWFLDNFPAVQGSIEEIRRNLSKKFYRELPKVLLDAKPMPRVYLIASTLVQRTSGKLDKQNITNFIQSYQTVDPLTISELWAFPLMLKFCLLEWIQHLALEISSRIRTVELANFWGNRFMHAAQRVPEQLPVLMSILEKEIPQPSSQFAEELVEHLFDEEASLSLIKKWLQSRFETPLTEVFHQEQLDEALEQVVFSSTMMSLLALAQIAWQDIFEEVSRVDAILREDPEGVYAQMDFSSRNLYRNEVEKIHKNSALSEVVIAQTCVGLAREAAGEIPRHVGYYLIDEGRAAFESKLSYVPTLKQRLQRSIKEHATLFYLGTVISAVIGLEALLFSYGMTWSQSRLLNGFLGALALIPLSEIVVQVFNYVLVRFLPIAALPKMDYDAGIPESAKTLVIVPMMLTSEEEIQEEVNRLEIRYLANTDDRLQYGLYSDYKDAPQQHMESDQRLIDCVIKEIERLELKYGPGKFFLFHRQRVWSKSENAWIGWERKRGKLESLNSYLMGETIPENILYFGQADALKGICYVITLDSDTQLSKNQGKKLVEILAHPLNKPILREDGKGLTRGYTIIQPAVSTDFPHAKNSLFLQIFSDPSVIDPYTHAISNVFQDLTGEASYHGKGIYDLKAFHSILSGRYPIEHILSHDLIEGAYVRVGFTGSVCLFDQFPENYLGLMNRQRRWIRGDWQILDWLFPKTPKGDGTWEINPLSLLNRWKIFDNLRRSLLPVALVLFFSLEWLTAQDSLLWTGLGCFVMLLPAFLQLISHLGKWTSYQSVISWREIKLGFQRALINIALLPQDAYFSLDSIFRVFYRRLISHRQLLEWTTSKLMNRTTEQAYREFLWKLCAGSVFAVLLLCIVGVVNPAALYIAFPVGGLWIIGPGILSYLNQSQGPVGLNKLTESDRKFLRRIARKTWRFFDDFVGPDTHWLPPDNYQAILNVGIAPRTSPTNIGLWLIAVLNAYDMKYLSSDHAIEQITETLGSLRELERFEGHFLNWYDIITLKPLYPRYISTVDSGNLLACFWTAQQTLQEMCTAPLVRFPALIGVEDAFRIALENRDEARKYSRELVELGNLLTGESSDIFSLIQTVHKSSQILQEMNLSETSSDYWLKAVEKQISEWQEFLARYFKWVPILKGLSEEELHKIHVHASLWVDVALNTRFSLQLLAEGALSALLNPLLEAALRPELSAETKVWRGELKEAVETAQWLAGEKFSEFTNAIVELEALSENMNLGYLYNSDRKLFAIGYNVDEMRLDRSFYDLLASEARLASLVAIAKDDVPVDHWWALSRPYGIANGVHVLLSWGGTMFEYLMPVLFNKYYPDSLLGNACYAAVECQIEYGRMRGIPWGISESAYSAIDAHKVYQYRSFGVLGLGLKRGLEKDLVVSPYSTLLALPINPRAAIDNLHRLAKAKNSLSGPYGYYESIDFTRQVDQEGERGVVIQAFMAHHQGMGFAAINNLLHDDIITKRFHSDPRISGVEFLLFEQLPLSPAIAERRYRKESGPSKLQPFSTIPIMGMTETPNTIIPKVNILSNHKYSVMLTNAGSGYSRWGDLDITRWRADTTRDNWGSFYYIKDLDSQEKWSTTYQPMLKEGTNYSSSFKVNKVEFRRMDHEIETTMEIVVSPEDNAEIRTITFMNKSNRQRVLEITSYLELVLATHAADRAHPAFYKLFVETTALPELNGLLAFRRLRAPDETQIWAAHLIALDEAPEGTLQYETSREEFIGRGRTLQNPIALENDLKNTSGTVLDPIFSLRHRFVLEPGKVTKLSFVTLVADNRAQIVGLMEKYQTLQACHNCVETAWTYSQLELRHLSITLEDVQLFQKLAGRILYPHKQLRASLERLINNKLGKSHLWKYGISGDIPLVAVAVDDAYDTVLVKQMLIAHAFWRSRGLKVDLLILNEEGVGYENPLKEQLLRLIQAHGLHTESTIFGGVYLFNINDIPNDDLTLMLALSSVFLKAARGSLRQQLVSPMPVTYYPPRLLTDAEIEETISRPLPFLELPYFNGLGGYSPDGKEYAIYLGPNTNTPAPWINVIANPEFGTLVSEAGNGCTWFGNSQSNRLNTWSNDPILNPITDALYIRDESTGTFWTPTPGPLRELDAYRVTHGQGYSRFEHNSHGIEQVLLITVPIDDAGGKPLRVQRLTLRNHSGISRRLTVTAYQDLVLGPNKEETQMQVVTEWKKESQAIFAYNRTQIPFGQCVAFSTSIPEASSYTGDRTEFIGRNGVLSTPVALKRRDLSNTVGAGFDPCAALQVTVELEPDAVKEVIFILGYALDADAAKRLISQFRTPESIDQLTSSTTQWWDTFLESIQVDVPDLVTNFALNRWLPYQNLSCRIWGRTAFYQSSGAYGYRDQLQDGMALVYSRPDLAREHIVRTAARQFVEGDVQHWWDPITGAGIRTRYSDDLLWLPFAIAHYVRTTGDISILDEQVPFLQAPLLEPDQHEVYSTPEITNDKFSLLEHCRRAIKKGMTEGSHGLPLIGGGDWNDGMNRVGIRGEGESVWLAWFLIHVLHDFVELLTTIGQQENTEEYAAEAERLAKVIEAHAWDGSWYRRAYYDNGAPLGSKESEEATIDSLAQSWAVISGSGEPQRTDTALQSAYQRLVKVNERVVLLLTPPFDKTIEDPGYIKGYPPGVRENGGQYTHGCLWLAMAYARRGEGNRAVELLRMMHPHSHTANEEETARYKIEPYVTAGDVYDLAGQVGRGGWSWYTGSAAWLYRIWVEEILGFKLRGNKFHLDCCIPYEWNGFKMRYRYKSSVYEITVENPHHLSKGRLVVVLDNNVWNERDIPLQDDGGVHTVVVTMKQLTG